MNRFYKRYSDVVFHLFKDNKWSNLTELSDKTGYSKSTIRRDLKFLETLIPEGWGFEKSESLGICLIKPENGTLESLLVQIREKNSYFHILKLILLNDGVDISQISQEVHISRSTAYRHLEKLQEVVREAGVDLSASPFKLVGDEKKIRRFIMRNLDFATLETYPDKDSLDEKEFQTTLLQLFSKHSMSFRTGALHRLTMILYISNLRVSMGYFVSYPKSVLINYEGSKYFEFSKELGHYMERCPTRDIQIQEIFYLAIYLMSEEKPLNRSQHLRYLRNRMKSKREFPLTQFLDFLSEYVCFNLSQDDIFLFHLYQTLKRISLETEFEIETVRNSMFQYLPYFEYNPIFQTIEELATKSFLTVPLKIKKLDVLEIFSLLQAAILRNKNQHTIIVALVCRTHTEKDYIREVLKYHYGNQVRISTFDPSSRELIYKYEEIDLIISTEEDTGVFQKIPVIKVSSFPTPSELMQIKQFFEDHFFDQFSMDPGLIYPYQKMNAVVK
ncbi:BglG family transcription antiterminator [Peribacillus frigoritolerans]|uniref:BglG family transcription antiterminator n=1 Tax=Peribacillus frigoritolerans TaxID=450367 RepID=UPI0032E4713F